MIFVADEAGLCVHVGREWTALTGQPIADSLGRGWIARVHPDDREVVQDVIATAVGKAGEFSLRYRILQADGETRWVAVGGIPSIGFPDSKFIGYLGSLVLLADDDTSGMTAYGNVGRFVPPPAHDLTTPQDHLDRIADHLILAHSMIENDGAKAALPALRMALFAVGRALADRSDQAPTLN